MPRGRVGTVLRVNPRKSRVPIDKPEIISNVCKVLFWPPRGRCHEDQRAARHRVLDSYAVAGRFRERGVSPLCNPLPGASPRSNEGHRTARLPLPSPDPGKYCHSSVRRKVDHAPRFCTGTRNAAAARRTPPLHTDRRGSAPPHHVITVLRANSTPPCRASARMVHCRVIAPAGKCPE